MGRAVRMVVADWDHPRDKDGQLIPMHEAFPYNANEVAEGLRDGWLSGNPPFYNVPVMPQWPAHLRTYFQMYEDTSEGTPISPAFESAEDLARWLTDNRASFFGGEPTSYDHWLAIIQKKDPGLPIFRKKGE